MHILFFDRNLQSIQQENDVVVEALESNLISFVNVIFQKSFQNDTIETLFVDANILINYAELCFQLIEDIIELNKVDIDFRNSVNFEQLAARVL